MNYPFVFAPRMHENISDCYSLVGDKNIQGNIYSVDDLLALHTTYFNPFVGKKNGAVKNYTMISSDFPFEKNEALQCLADFRENSLDYDHEIQNNHQSHSTIHDTHSSYFLGGSEKKINKDEEFALDNFAKGSFEEKTSGNTKLEDEKIEQKEILKQKEVLKQAQTLLILAWLQEEQDMDLFVIQQKIQEKDQVIKSLLSNPYEKQLLESEMSHEELFQELHADFLEKEEDIKASFSFNVLKEKQIVESKILSYEWSKEDFDGFEFSTDWKKVFLAQLYFIPQDVIFVVNDSSMRNDLLNIAMDNKGEVLFDEDITMGNYEQKEILMLQKMCFQNNLSYSFLSCPFEIIFKKNQLLSAKYNSKKISFVLKRD